MLVDRFNLGIIVNSESEAKKVFALLSSIGEKVAPLYNRSASGHSYTFAFNRSTSILIMWNRNGWKWYPIDTHVFTEMSKITALEFFMMYEEYKRFWIPKTAVIVESKEELSYVRKTLNFHENDELFKGIKSNYPDDDICIKLTKTYWSFDNFHTQTNNKVEIITFSEFLKIKQWIE